MKTAKEILQGFVNKQKEVHLDYATVLQAMELYANQDKWISVNDRLPEHRVMGISVDVIVFDGKDVFQDCYDYEFNNWCKNKYKSIVTHWMPLPEPPKV